MAYPGFQRRGCLRSGPIRKVKSGGGGGAIRFRSDIKSGRGGGGGNSLQVQYEKWGGGGGGGGAGAGQFASGVRYEKWGGGPFRFRSDTFVWHTEKIYMYLPTCYLGILHTRARRMNLKYMPAKVNLL